MTKSSTVKAIETALDELRRHLRGARIVLRSKTPDPVRQEFYGLLIAHFALRALMHEAALTADEDPDRLSFLHAVRVIRRKLSVYGAVSPSGQESLSWRRAAGDPSGAGGCVEPQPAQPARGQAQNEPPGRQTKLRAAGRPPVEEVEASIAVFFRYLTGGSE